MKLFKKSLAALFIIILIFVISIFIFIWNKKPSYEGKILIENISNKTTVYYDEYGIPHIYATSQKDAMTVLGYVHAQDRLWQMELIRRIAPGRLSEIFGSKALANDQFFAGIGINENSEKTIQKYVFLLS